MKILIVDDDLFNRTFMGGILADFGQCDLVSSGVEAVAAFTKALDEGSPYRLVTMDIIMPVMDGKQALREIRALEDARSVGLADAAKIIMVTSQDDPDSVLTSYDARCDSYLTKPIDGRILKDKIAFLGLKP